MEPSNVYREPPGQKLYVDTVAPVVKITAAERAGDEIKLSWEAHDDHPDWGSLVCEYRPADRPNGQWRSVPIEPGPRGNLRFRPTWRGAVVVRLSVRDKAGNRGVGERDVRIQRRSSDPLPPLQIVNKRKAKIEFEVPRTGPSGLGSVDVYVTTDDGASWTKSVVSPSNVPPIETRAQGPVVGTVTVPLPREGVTYGFYLVTRSRAGLGKPPPQPGDNPQVRLEADTTPPVAELYAPQPDPGNRDRLLLRWKVSDRNLTPNPVSLEWSASPRGPWSFIGEPELPNNGRYTWQVPDTVPPRVYLRLSARDRAGNTAIAQTPQPVYIDLEVPDGPVIKGTSGQP
jgi:hypothetical protein